MNLLQKNGLNKLTPPKITPEWVKFLKKLFSGFSILLWIGSILCFSAISIDYFSELTVEMDNVFFI